MCKYDRIITHDDLDGVISGFFMATIFKIPVENIIFTTPNDMKAGQVYTTKRDIVCDLPQPKVAGLWADHHISNKPNIDSNDDSIGVWHWFLEPSCAAVIYRMYASKLPCNRRFQSILKYTNKIDSGDLTPEEVLNPSTAGIISITLRSGNRREDDDYRRWVISELMRGKSFSDIANSDWAKRRFFDKRDKQKSFKDITKRRLDIREHGVAVLDVCDIPGFSDSLYEIYAEYPEVEYLISVSFYGDSPEFVRMNVGMNIFKKDQKRTVPNIGDIMKRYGGGGHVNVGGIHCIDIKKYKRVVDEIVLLIQGALAYSTYSEYSH